MGCFLGANLGPTWRPRRFQDEPEVEKKGSKNVKKIEVYVGSRPELENESQNDAPDLIFARFSRPSWQDFQGFSKDFSDYASAASERAQRAKRAERRHARHNTRPQEA